MFEFDYKRANAAFDLHTKYPKIPLKKTFEYIDDVSRYYFSDEDQEYHWDIELLEKVYLDETLLALYFDWHQPFQDAVDVKDVMDAMGKTIREIPDEVMAYYLFSDTDYYLKELLALYQELRKRNEKLQFEEFMHNYQWCDDLDVCATDWSEDMSIDLEEEARLDEKSEPMEKWFDDETDYMDSDYYEEYNPDDE